MRAWLLGAFLFPVLLGPTQAVQARDYHVSLLGGAQIVANRDVDALSADDGLPLVHLDLGLELPELSDGLSIELGYQSGKLGSTLFAGDEPWLRSALRMHGLTVGAAYRMPLTNWLILAARAGGTVDFARLRITDDGALLLGGWSMARLGAYGLLGFEIALPRTLWRRWLNRPAGDPRDGFTLGIRLEAGWAYRQPFDYDGVRAPGSGVDPVQLGDVHLDGALFRAGIFAVF